MDSLATDAPPATLTSHLPPTPPSEAAAPTTTAKMTSNLTTTNDNTMATRSLKDDEEIKHIWVITGPAGCGKTSVAEHLHTHFALPYLEGDTFHTPENVAKMRAGQPLTDTDRWDWLILLREEALSALSPQPTKTNPMPEEAKGVIVTCSALKRKYRDVLRIAAYHHPHVRVHFLFLSASEALLMDRVRARQGHYMKDYMVRSQFQSLETPTQDEGDVLSVDAGGSSEEVQRLSEEVVKGIMEEGGEVEQR